MSIAASILGRPRKVPLLLLAGMLLGAASCAPSKPVLPKGTEPAGPAATAQPTGVSQPAAVPAAEGEASICPPSGAAKALTGAGATFPAPLYTRWFDEYNRLCNVKVNYQPIGSGGGIRQHTEKTVDFGASDGIMTDKQKQDAPGTLMIPMTAGAVAVVVNLDGVNSGQVRLTPEVLSGIYLGQITKWDDPKLVEENQSLKLPNKDIAVVHRSDGSGTTNIFTTYLSQVSEEWSKKVGKGNSVQWPAGLGGEGNAGVAGQVRQIPGAIGYVELAYAVQNRLTWVALRNKAGSFIEPSLQGTMAAMEGVTLPDSTEVMITDAAGQDAYPIAGFTWILAYENQQDKAKAQTLATVLWWAIHDGQKFSSDLEYAPLAPAAVQKAEALVKKIKFGGQPALP